ncbi:MAG: hypothetical protein R3309_12175, partial [Reinekea sp.]|nr:hypothetical protein [Reinekea sp.]
MAKKKPAQKKAARSKPTSGNKGILSFLMLPIGIIVIALAAAAYLLVSTQAAPVNERHRAALIDGIASQYEAYINNVLDQHNALMSQIAASPIVIDQISIGDPTQLREVEQFIVSQIPNALTVHVFPVREAVQDNTS